MAIYAKRDGTNLIVAAADSLVEMEELFTRTSGVAGLRLNRPTAADMMMDERFQSLKAIPGVYEFDARPEQDTFADQYGITVIGPNKLVDRHTDMLEKLEEDPYFLPSEDEDDPDRVKRTIGEMHGINKDDPWDKRSDEDKVKDEAYKKKYEAAKKAGKLSGDDSFAPPGSQARVTDIDTTRNADGTISIDKVLATKGVYEDNDRDRREAEKRVVGRGAPAGGKGTPNKKASGRSIEDIVGGVLNPEEGARLQAQADRAVGAEDEDVISIRDLMAQMREPILDENGVDMTISESDDIPMFYKLEFVGAHVADLEAVLDTNEVWGNVHASRDTGDDCWFAFVRHKHGLAFENAATEAGFKIAEHPFGVKPDGDRLVEKSVKGVTVVDTGEKREIGPRPWNARAAELEKMTEEERAEEWKNCKGDEFIFCGTYEGAAMGTIVYITPKSYFEEHGVMFDQPLNIDHLIERDVKEITPGGIYRTLSRDWNSLSFALSKKGMVENMYLQLYLNTL
jgi:hypothetical protein